MDRIRIWVADVLKDASEKIRPKMTRGSPLGTWHDQWSRVLIGLHRIEKLTKDRDPSEGTLGASFDVYGFFLNCYHLSDWIENDTEDHTLSGRARKDARHYARNNATLMICADIANRSKHSALDWAHTRDLETGLFSISLNITPGESASYDFVMQSGGPTPTALELATACVEAWEAYFVLKHITP